MADTYRVQRRQDNGRVVVLFDGANEDDAQHYVHENFPRPHIEPGSVADRLRADVQLVSPDGSVREFHGNAGWVDIDEDDQIVSPFDDDDDDDDEEVE